MVGAIALGEQIKQEATRERSFNDMNTQSTHHALHGASRAITAAVLHVELLRLHTKTTRQR